MTHMVAGSAGADLVKGLSRVRGNSQALVLRGLPLSNGGGYSTVSGYLSIDFKGI